AKVDKAGFDHYMAKEIAEQPAVVGAAINNYLPTAGDDIVLPGGDIDFTKIERLTMVACGTAFYACLTAKYWFEKLARIPVEVDVASEFRYREPPIPAQTAALFVSQSGETADTLAALRYCTGKADKILSVTNVAESSIARESDQTYPIFAGVEIGVASTKAFTCQLTVLLSLALKAARDRGTMSEQHLREAAAAMRALPGLLNVALEQSGAIKAHARKLAEARDILFLGRGLMYPIAHESALKLKEISYIHAEAYASGELKHGPIALIDKKVPVVVLAPSDDLYDKSISNMQEVMARSGKVLLISDRKGLEHAGDVWGQIVMPECHTLISPIVYSIPAQLLAYHTAVAKGTDVDQPRNLAKSVTVE
ncbi:MAG: glutamine--fructose-6-phosphate transaminase (isomerizing), partial [Planktotalea arctica]